MTTTTLAKARRATKLTMMAKTMAADDEDNDGDDDGTKGDYNDGTRRRR
jgi:hypothetical protein